jgi:hypothetical protein
MNDAALYQELIASNGGKMAKASTKLSEFLRGKGVAEPAIAYFSNYVLKKDFEISSVVLYAEKEILNANGDDYIPIALRDGLLVVGHCDNGDPIAIDVRDQLGAAGYIAHETMWDESSVRTVFKVLAPGLGALATGLEEETMPEDYYEAVARG